MCGRFALWTPPGTITRYFNVNVQLESVPSYNIAPGQNIIAIRQPEIDSREIAFLKWGLIPRWAKEEKIGYKMINARSETIFEKSSFKAAARHRRCIIPVSGFYEWKKETSGKQPHLIRYKSSDLFALAGIWESWNNPKSGEIIETCAIITTTANSVVRKVHDRMPVIIAPENFDLWLDTGKNDAGLLDQILQTQPFTEEEMICYPVGKAVNNVKNDNSALVDPDESKERGLFSSKC